MSEERFEGWAILELMGHRRLAGYVREVELAGSGMLRLDVPDEEDGDKTCEECGANSADGCICEPALGPVQATQFYSPSAVYCLTPTTEQLARDVARRARPQPVTRFELPPAPALATVRRAGDDVDDDERIPF